MCEKYCRGGRSPPEPPLPMSRMESALHPDGTKNGAPPWDQGQNGTPTLIPRSSVARKARSMEIFRKIYSKYLKRYEHIFENIDILFEKCEDIKNKYDTIFENMNNQWKYEHMFKIFSYF